MILLTFRDALNLFLKNNAFYIALIIVGIILITFALILIIGDKKKKK